MPFQRNFLKKKKKKTTTTKKPKSKTIYSFIFLDENVKYYSI